MMQNSSSRPVVEVRDIVADLRQKYISLDRDRQFRQRFDLLLGCDAEGNPVAEPIEFTKTGESRGLLVVDGAGGGKTSLVRRALDTHPALQPTAATMPCVSITVPNPATMKSVGFEILKATGYTNSERNRTAWNLWNDVRIRFQILGTKVLWIDEAHDLFPNGSKSEAPAILKTLKSLMQGESAVIVILSGTETLWESITFDDQVRRRFAKFALPSVTAASDGGNLWGLLQAFCTRADLGTPERGDLVERLVHASRHRFGLCVEQMIAAIEAALLSGDTRLDIRHFAEAYFAQEGCTIAENVYLAVRWSAIDLGRRGASNAA
jgi:hypothetical protein